jgi:hypothetical protein
MLWEGGPHLEQILLWRPVQAASLLLCWHNPIERTDRIWGFLCTSGVLPHGASCENALQVELEPNLDSAAFPPVWENYFLVSCGVPLFILRLFGILYMAVMDFELEEICERNRSWSCESHFPTNSIEYLKKITVTLIMRSDVTPRIWTKHLPQKKKKCNFLHE